MLFILFAIFPFLCFGQQEFSPLNNKGKEFFSERNTFLKDSLWHFNQELKYDDPHIIDEENWTRLTIEIKDTSKFLITKKIDLKKDTTAFNYFFAAYNVWLGFPPDKTSISGEITLISLKEKKIGLGFDLVVTNLDNGNKYLYKGEREFTRTYTIQSLYHP